MLHVNSTVSSLQGAMEGGDISTDQVSELLSNMVAKLKVLKRKVGFPLTVLVVLILLTLLTDEIVPVVEIILAPLVSLHWVRSVWLRMRSSVYCSALVA